MKKHIASSYGALSVVLFIISTIFIGTACAPKNKPIEPETIEPEVPVDDEDTPPSTIGGVPLGPIVGFVPADVEGLSGSDTDNANEETSENPNSGAERARHNFDIYSWKLFIALNWPVEDGQRGVPLNPSEPNTFLKMSNTTPVVWASYKNQFDLFGQGDSRPSEWSSWDNPVNLCPDGTPPSHIFGTAKGNTLDGGEIDEAFSVPLIDQAKNYTLFEMRYNQVQYDFVRGNDAAPASWLYLKKNLVKVQMANGMVDMPVSSPPRTQGAIMVKAAWKELTDKDDASIYYVINENVYDPVTKTCTQKKMGLVGLHLVQKVEGFKEWIWSSFEHRNNVPGQGEQKPYSYNNGTDDPKTIGGWANRPDSTEPNPDSSTRVPTQVTRFNEIPTTPAGISTVDVNAAYWEILSGTVWANYQLIITQWPQKQDEFVIYGESGGIYPEGCGDPFPINGCTNTAAETFFQSADDATGKGGNSCMSCHYQASAADFSWSLQLKSH